MDGLHRKALIQVRLGGPFISLRTHSVMERMPWRHIPPKSAEKELDRSLALPLLSCRPTNRLRNFCESTVMQAYRLNESCHISS
jgi:hypothetical protein